MSDTKDLAQLRELAEKRIWNLAESAAIHTALPALLDALEAAEKREKQRIEDLGFDEATETRWQNRIYKLLLKRLPSDTDEGRIDGLGCESGDALDVTEHEISQCITEWENKFEAAQSALAAERERVIEECARLIDSLPARPDQDVCHVCAEDGAAAIRALAPPERKP